MEYRERIIRERGVEIEVIDFWKEGAVSFKCSQGQRSIGKFFQVAL